MYQAQLDKLVLALERFARKNPTEAAAQRTARMYKYFMYGCLLAMACCFYIVPHLSKEITGYTGLKAAIVVVFAAFPLYFALIFCLKADTLRVLPPGLCESALGYANESPQAKIVVDRVIALGRRLTMHEYREMYNLSVLELRVKEEASTSGKNDKFCKELYGVASGPDDLDELIDGVGAGPGRRFLMDLFDKFMERAERDQCHSNLDTRHIYNVMIATQVMGWHVYNDDPRRHWRHFDGSLVTVTDSAGGNRAVCQFPLNSKNLTEGDIAYCPTHVDDGEVFDWEEWTTAALHK